MGKKNWGLEKREGESQKPVYTSTVHQCASHERRTSKAGRSVSFLLMLIYLLNLSKNLPRSTGRNFPCNEILLKYRLVQYFFHDFPKIHDPSPQESCSFPRRFVCWRLLQDRGGKVFFMSRVT
jgi:hypothetical protein